MKTLHENCDLVKSKCEIFSFPPTIATKCSSTTFMQGRNKYVSKENNAQQLTAHQKQTKHSQFLFCIKNRGQLSDRLAPTHQMQHRLMWNTHCSVPCSQKTVLPALGYYTQERHSPLTEGVQAGQDFGVLVAVQTYAADQELLVNLADHGTGNSGAFTGHPRTLTWESLFLVPCTLQSETKGGQDTTHDQTVCRGEWKSGVFFLTSSQWGRRRAHTDKPISACWHRL